MKQESYRVIGENIDNEGSVIDTFFGMDFDYFEDAKRAYDGLNKRYKTGQSIRLIRIDLVKKETSLYSRKHDHTYGSGRIGT